MPVFIAKHNEHNMNFGEEPQELIGTIRVPRNLSLLTERLPASQYELETPHNDVQRSSAPVLNHLPVSVSLPQIAETRSTSADDADLDADGGYVPMVAAIKSGAERNARNNSIERQSDNTNAINVRPYHKKYLQQ